MKRIKMIGLILFPMLLITFSVSSHIVYAEALPGGSLDPTTIPKYIDPLIIPPELPYTSIIQESKKIPYYEIAVRQFKQKILPSTGYGKKSNKPFPMTTVWSYGSINHPGTFNYPAFTIETKVDQPTRVKWINDLVDENGNFLPHILPVDQTLHWANPPMDCLKGDSRTDCRGESQDFYTGPVPIVTHVHGAHVGPESDGYPEAWWLPDANNIPAGYATQGTLFDQYDPTNTDPGTAVFQYPNDQRETTLWYHDHSLGMTRLNVYAGPAGFWLIRGDEEDALDLPEPAPKLGDPPGMKYFEIPIVIQDRSFNKDGSLFYPDNRAFFEGLQPKELKIDFIPDSDVAPIWNPEAFFNTIVVNGRTWPNQDVEPRKYRFRLLNGCNSRFLILKLVSDPLAERPAMPTLSFNQIGAEGGLLPAPIELYQLLIAPAERADVIVDFSGLPVGTEIFLINEGPDEPFGGGVPGTDFDPADPGTSGQVMKFTVVPLTEPDNSKIPKKFTKIDPLIPTNTRKVSLNEEESQEVCIQEKANGTFMQIKNVKPGPHFEEDCEEAGGEVFGPTAALLGTVDDYSNGVPLLWANDVTENPELYSTEAWEIYNFTEDAHPIHLHLVQFQVMNREIFDSEVGEPGTVYPPQPWETGFKDTVIAFPGEITRIKAHFDISGLYVWHCHIVEHEDNEMMRPYCVGSQEDCPIPIAP
jgi:FtsP/CotA-like multicopper oxidase with cupredoxin domain